MQKMVIIAHLTVVVKAVRVRVQVQVQVWVELPVLAEGAEEDDQYTGDMHNNHNHSDRYDLVEQRIWRICSRQDEGQYCLYIPKTFVVSEWDSDSLREIRDRWSTAGVVGEICGTLSSMLTSST